MTSLHSHFKHPAWASTAVLIGVVVGWLTASSALPWTSGNFVTWMLPVLALAYLAFGAIRGELRTRGVLSAQVAALAVLTALALASLAVSPDVGRYLVAAGWLAHAVWDAVHHRSDRVVPRGYALFCVVADVIVAAVLVLPLEGKI
ncbi:hypothetical protein [Actinomadura hibisca]|uniref:hypothetical protein n=1 Tax=Actinomadura hibisca TaxID=68565 RepID=UPI000835EFA9|nr:hypothetical protein [Actinomadura hibisca]